MAFNLESISTKAVHKPPTMIVVAREKTGKTSFCAGDRVENGEIVEYGLNKPIILWTRGEEGCNDIPVAKNDKPINTYDELMEAIGWLATSEHDFQTVAVDSLTTVCELVHDKVVSEHPDLNEKASFDRYGNGNKLAIPLHRELTNALTYLRNEKNMTVIVTAHIKRKPQQVNDPERGSYDAWIADVDDAIWAVYAKAFDFVGFADTKDVVSQKDIGMGKTQGRVTNVGNGARFLFTKKTLAHPSGGRGIYGHLPPEIPFDWVSFQNAIAETIAKLNNNTNKEN